MEIEAMMGFRSTDSRAIVTGAGSGIGRAFAIALDESGCSVLLVGRNVIALHKVKNELRNCLGILSADLSTAAGLEAVVAACPRRLDVLVHSAGLYCSDPVHQTTWSDWDALYAVNLRAPMLITSKCLPALLASSGQVIFVNSTAALQSNPNASVYAAVKQALKVTVDALRRELKGTGVRVLTVFPGRTDTNMQKAILLEEGRSDMETSLIDAENLAKAVLNAIGLSNQIEITDLIVRPENL